MTEALQAYVARAAEADEHAVAVAMGDEWLTYGSLDAASNQIAWMLRSTGCRPGDRVALFMRKAPHTIAAMIGALKADCLYLPMDVSNPLLRAEKILRTAAPRAILIDRSAAALVDALADVGALQGVVVGAIDDAPDASARLQPDFARADWRRCPTSTPGWTRSGSDAAHILFTSGSTGLPKGVKITHANVIHFVEWARRYFGITSRDRTSGHAPLHFDLSTFDVFGTFAAGACLYPVPPELNLLPHEIAAFIRSNELTQWFSVPSLLTYMVRHGAVGAGDFPTLERLMWCGEALPTPTLIALMERLPHVTFTNLYGPTEATVASSHHTVGEAPRDPTAPIPIGVACDGEELWVLDDRQQPVVDGEVGELCISGVGLSPGYWQDEERTRQAFLPHPFDPDPEARLYRTGDLGRRDAEGRFYCLGRTDSQIKSRGYRIELGEIEAAVNAIGSLEEVAVVAIATDRFEGTIICCAYASPERLPPDRVRERLTQRLPSYMLPARWMTVDALPKNANGKIDRPELRRRFEELGR